MRHRLMGGILFLKKHVLPHKFACQSSNKIPQQRSAVEKRRRAEYYEKVLSKDVQASVAQQPIEFIEFVHNNEEIPDFEDPLPMDSYDVEMESSVEIKTKNKGIQVNIKDKKADKSCQTKFRQSNIKFTEKKILQCDDISEDTTEASSDNVSLSSSFSGMSCDELVENYTNSTVNKIKSNSQLYFGLSQENYFLIESLVNNVKRPQIDILVALKKIRLNDSYSRLAIDFGQQKAAISKIIRKTLTPLAHFMRELIYFPEKSAIEENLPLAFRTRFSKTQSIIDCFEIRIQQPSNAVHQSLTWSNYKGCNTLKYLISVTPNGFINFISSGYGGRVDDATLFEDCKIIDKIPKGSTILADRGFKHIAPIVEKNGCRLVRPPSVKSGTVCDKADVIDTKRIAAVRIHVERSIGRLRDFKMLGPHACVNVKMLPYFDDIVSIGCGLVNLQSLLIKQ